MELRVVMIRTLIKVFKLILPREVKTNKITVTLIEIMKMLKAQTEISHLSLLRAQIRIVTGKRKIN